MSITSKPKILYVVHPIHENISPFIKYFVFESRERVLRHCFNVEIVEPPFDLGEKMEEIQPDAVIVPFYPKFQDLQEIRNASKRTIPLIGLFLSEIVSPERYFCFDYFRTLHADAVFICDPLAGTRFSAWSEKMYYLPWSIDETMFHDHDVRKENKVLMLGHNHLTYPWRREIFKQIAKYGIPHFRLDYKKGSQQYYKESFSHLIGQYQYAPTCGGYDEIVVRKHLEIPASKTLLITENTEAVRMYGFRDMENCVFANESNFRSKMTMLLRNPLLVQEITNRGFEFVHEHFEDRHREELKNWVVLYHQKKPNQRIVQDGFINTLRISDDSADTNYWVTSNRETVILDEADQLFWHDRYSESYKKYLWLYNNYLTYSPDTLLRLCLTQLLQGKIHTATNHIWWLVCHEAGLGYKPEPIEWYVYLLCKSLQATTLEQIRNIASLLDAFPYHDAYCITDLIQSNILIRANMLVPDDIAKRLEENTYVEFFSAHTLLHQPQKELQRLLNAILLRYKKFPSKPIGGGRVSDYDGQHQSLADKSPSGIIEIAEQYVPTPWYAELLRKVRVNLIKLRNRW